jgi:membrane fusion protein, multidrug efflux system
MNVKDQTIRWTRLSLAAALVAAAAGCNRGTANAEPPDTGITIGPENITVVRTEAIRSGPEISGSLEPDEQATVRAEVQGAVLATYAEAGQRVKKGQLLARLDDTALREQALSAKSAVATAQDAADIAQRNLQRSEALIKVGAIADRDLESARNAAMAAQTQLDNARAVYANAEKTLDKTVVRAPFDGVVAARTANGGDFLSPGGAMFTIVNPATMRLEASVPANALDEVKIGMPVAFEVTGYPGQSFVGHITRMNPTADPTTRQVAIVARIPNAGQSLVGGLFADGRVATSTRESPVVPMSAVDQAGIRPTVMALRGGRATPVVVELGIRDNVAETVEILHGLSSGDTVLVGAARGISPGTPVVVSAPTDVKP